MKQDHNDCVMHLPINGQFHLTEFRSTDRTECVQHLSNRDIYDRTLRIPYPYTDADFEEWLTIVARATKRHGEPVHFAIRASDGSLVGGCGFDGLSEGHHAEIGYWLAKPYWGQGVMTSVVGRACEHAWTRWKLVRITAHVFEFNLASARVLEKNGFVCEGYLRKHFLKDEQFIDSKLYAMVR
jgi:RimJ/RimL family protein N-acetyltransferase